VSFVVAVLAGHTGYVQLEPRFDLRVLAFAAAVSIATALLFSLAPALRVTRVDAAQPGSGGRSIPPNRLGGALVVVQVTLSVLLLCGAALFVRTLRNLTAVPFGFDPAGVLTMQIEGTLAAPVAPKIAAEYRADFARRATIWRSFIERVQQLPGVSSAALAAGMSPLSGRIRGIKIAIDGPAPGPVKDRGIRIDHVTDRYFETAGIRLLAGRSFTPHDLPGSTGVAILNDTAARAFFGADSPLGRSVTFPGQRVEGPFVIVGVAADAHYQDLRTPDKPMVYVPLDQAIDPIDGTVLYLRGSGDLAKLVPSIRATAAAAMPSGFVSNIATLEQELGMSVVRERMLALLATFFAALALLLACIGLYGTTAYGVARRTREIGIRIAIGARRESVLWMVVRETLLLVAAGAVLGTLASLVANRYVASQLFGVTPRDPVAIVAALMLLTAVTMIAGYLPARRASLIDPVKALRSE
jgi:predicted permease